MIAKNNQFVNKNIESSFNIKYTREGRTSVIPLLFSFVSCFLAPARTEQTDKNSFLQIPFLFTGLDRQNYTSNRFRAQLSNLDFSECGS